MYRTSWIDFAKGVAISLVVLGHAIRGVEASGIPVPSFWLDLDTLIYAFHMPLFFALSGWFFIHSLVGKSFIDFSVNRLERIFYPMILWTYIFFACKILAGQYTNSPITLAKFPLVPVPGLLHFWFLWDLLILVFVAYPLSFTLRNGKIVPSTWILSIVMVFCIGYISIPPTFIPWVGSAISNAPFFLAGVILGQAMIPTKFGKHSVLFLAVLFVVFYLGRPVLENLGLQTAGTLILVICALGILRGLEPMCPAVARTAINVLGAASMSIYLAHTIFSAALREALSQAGLTNPSILIIFGTIVGILGPLAMLFVARNFGISRQLGLEAKRSKSRLIQY